MQANANKKGGNHVLRKMRSEEKEKDGQEKEKDRKEEKKIEQSRQLKAAYLSGLISPPETVSNGSSREASRFAPKDVLPVTP